MVDLPDIGNMSPDAFLSRLQRMRTELVDEMGRLFEEGNDTESTAQKLRHLFDEYALGDETTDPRPLVQVDEDDGRLVFSREEADAPIVLRQRDGRWVREGDHAPPEADGAGEDLAVEILKIVPWWSEGAFVERVGNPQQARGKSLTDEESD